MGESGATHGSKAFGDTSHAGCLGVARHSTGSSIVAYASQQAAQGLCLT